MRTLFLAVTGAVVGLTACSSGGTSTLPVERTAVASVVVALPSSSLLVGQTARGTATARDASGNSLPDRAITWQTSSTAIANVDNTGMISAVAPGTAEIIAGLGLVSAVAAGTAQITATSEGQSGSAALAVVSPPPPPAPVASVTVTLAASSRAPGQTTQATAVTRDANNNVLTGRVITWSSGNLTVATVSGSGLVTALVAGTAQITATSEGQSGSATFTVTAPPPPAPVASVTVTLAASTRNPGQTTQATAVTLDANNNVLTGRVITWVSGTPAVATVSSTGLVTAVAVGTAQISATSEGQTGSATLTVQDPPPPPPPGSSNEPSGMTVISDRPFNALNELGWDDQFSSNMAFIADATAPKSPSGILRATWPTGYTSIGNGPGGSDMPISSKRTVYISFWAKLSDNFYGHDSNVNKQFYAYANQWPVMYFDASCHASGPITPQIALQDTQSHGTYDLTPNLVPSARIPRSGGPVRRLGTCSITRQFGVARAATLCPPR